MDPQATHAFGREFALSVSICSGLLFWSERRDLNPRPLVPQTSALTGLSHAPNDSTIVSAHQYRNSRWLGARASQNGNPR